MHALLKRRELSSVGRPVSAASMHLGLAYQWGAFLTRRVSCCDAADEPHVLCRHHRCTSVQEDG